MGAPPSALRQSQAEAAALRFKKKTEALCARCLAPAHHHLASACRDKFRCLSGHKERNCPLRLAARAAKRRQGTQALPQPRSRPSHSSPSAPGARSWAAIVAAAPPVAAVAPASSPSVQLPPPPTMAHSGIGSAATRPEEDTVIIATSFELDQEMKDWEATAAIDWVVNGNRKIEAKAIDRAILKEFRLSHRDLNICPHQPVQFLLKFEHKAHCTEVLKRGRIKADNALLQLRPWRPLEHAFGAAMSSPRRRNCGGGGHGRRHGDDVHMVDAPSAAVPPTPSGLDVDLRSYIAEQGALLRADLLACLKDIVAPILAESAALRAWQGRALSFLDKACRPLPPPRPLIADNIVPGASGSPSLGDTTDPNDAGNTDPPPSSVDAGLLGQLMQLNLSSPGNGNGNGYADVGFGSGSQGQVICNIEPLPTLPLMENEAWHGVAPSLGSPGAASPPLLELPPVLLSGNSPTLSPPRQATDTAQVSQGSDGAVDSFDPLHDFLATVAGHVVQPLLVTPPLRKKKKPAAAAGSPRRSGRIAIKKKARQLSEGSVAIQELIARVCGILAPAASFDDASLAAYQQLFLKAPLAATAIQALEALVKQVKKVKKKSPATPVAKTVAAVSDV